MDALGRYEALLFHAFEKLRTDPTPHGSKPFEQSVFLYHLRFCKNHAEEPAFVVKNPRHFIAYRFNDTSMDVLRILHDNMDLSSHI